jgi:hypothetical protein
MESWFKHARNASELQKHATFTGVDDDEGVQHEYQDDGSQDNGCENECFGVTGDIHKIVEKKISCIVEEFSGKMKSIGKKRSGGRQSM